MDRRSDPRQLSSPEFRRAVDSDDAEIRGLLQNVPMDGALRIGFSREPSYFKCRAPIGDEEETLVARRDGKLLSVGSWSEREVWLNGERKLIGYLHGLRMVPGTEGSMRLLREGYASLASHTSHSEAVGWFTSVAADNVRARRVLESRASGLPRYERIGEYRTQIFPVQCRGEFIPIGSVDSTEEINQFLNQEGARYDLALTWSEERWQALARAGFTPVNVMVIRRRGRIVAAAGIWDQTAWKQVVIHQYPRWVSWLRPVIGLSAACLNKPSLPLAGVAVPIASIFPFAVEQGFEGVLPELWQGLEGMARHRRVSWLALGLGTDDLIWQHIRRVGISYRTILHWVCGKGFPARPAHSINRFIRPECAIL